MIKSKGWDWEHTEKSYWLKPAEDCVYLAHKWEQQGFRRILDLGAGLGRHAMYFASQGFDVSAMDISEYGIEHLKTWAASEGLSIHTDIGDMLSLPYPDGAFDCAFAYHVISHSDTDGVKQVISEIERMLGPQGEVFLTFSSKESDEYLESSSEARVDQNTIIRHVEPESGVPHFYANLGDVADLLRDFTIEKVRQIEYCSVDQPAAQRRRYLYVSAVLR